MESKKNPSETEKLKIGFILFNKNNLSEVSFSKHFLMKTIFETNKKQSSAPESVVALVPIF